jgi:phosphate transport system regulatory protein PhoU
MAEVTNGHIVKRFDSELFHLRGLVLEMGGLVLDQIVKAVKALHDKDLEAARQVITRDHEVNALEVKTDEECVSLLARRAPMASDLRAIMSASKALTDLERIGDKAKKIARLTIHIYDSESSTPNQKLLRDVDSMSKLAESMLRASLDAFDRLDLEKAVELYQGDAELDAEFQSALRRLVTFILEDARTVGHAMNVLFIIKALERVGDHAKNIAEQVIYLVKGKDVRHVSPATLADEALDKH